MLNVDFVEYIAHKILENKECKKMFNFEVSIEKSGFSLANS